MTGFPYDTAYDPVMPVFCEVTLVGGDTDERVTLQGIVDTGADATLVPVAHLQAIGARRVFETGLRSQWGERRTVFLYLVDVSLGEHMMSGVYVVGDDLGNELVIGRDILNRLRLTLDGPASHLHLLA